MSDLYEKYRQGRTPLPPDYRRWHLYGAGLENVGRDGEPETVSLAQPGPGELLVRHDTCGICYSDIKIINLGEEHPRLAGRDLQANPVVMGHEVALTILAVGAGLESRFAPGQRYIVQADIYYQGRNLAYGYALPGGMSQYGLIGPEVLDGDEGCYLLPIRDETGYVEAALVEPWACVEAAYHWTHRDGIREHGHTLFVKRPWESSVPHTPTTVKGPNYTYTSWNGVGELPGVESGFDDILFLGAPEPEVFEAACAHLAKDGVVCLKFTDRKAISRPVRVDIGRIHYDGHRYIGTTSADLPVADIYRSNRRGELKAGGIAWCIGAAGPMGQMHIQRALSLPEPPRRILCTDRHDIRLDALEQRFGAAAREKGVELLPVNVRKVVPDFAAIAPDGFDDIVVMVPSIEAIEEAFPYLARDGVMNVFAGVARGTMASLDISLVALKNVRIVGTSGSSIEDMRMVRDKMEAGTLDTGASLAAVGGLNSFREGLDGVKNSRFPGKTVIFPQIPDLPLTALPDLASVRPEVYARLRNGQFWTREAEEELLREALTEAER